MKLKSVLAAVLPMSVALVLLLLAGGVFVPYLLTAKDTLAVLGGIVLVVVSLVLAFSLGLYGVWKLMRVVIEAF